jgi:hypothetical protein
VQLEGNHPSSGWSGHGNINAVERLVCHHFLSPGMDMATPNNFHSNLAVDCGECPSLCAVSAAISGDQDRMGNPPSNKRGYVQALEVHNAA